MVSSERRQCATSRPLGRAENQARRQFLAEERPPWPTGRRLRSSHPAVSAFPEIAVGSACTSTFSRSHEAMVATGDLGA